MRFAIVLLMLALPGPLAAQGFCFGRYYDEDHMRGHPVQTVEEIFFGTLTGRPMLQVRLKSSATYVYGFAECRGSGAVLVCDVENGQGDFTTERQGDGTLMLRIGARDVMLERGGDQEIVFLQHDSGDDRVFRLYPGKGCIS